MNDRPFVYQMNKNYAILEEIEVLFSLTGNVAQYKDLRIGAGGKDMAPVNFKKEVCDLGKGNRKMV